MKKWNIEQVASCSNFSHLRMHALTYIQEELILKYISKTFP